jgi:hypothetical protein
MSQHAVFWGLSRANKFRLYFNLKQEKHHDQDRSCRPRQTFRLPSRQGLMEHGVLIDATCLEIDDRMSVVNFHLGAVSIYRSSEFAARQ